MLIKPNLLVYLRHDNLIVGGPKLTPSSLKFPEDIMENLEILDEPRYIETISAFFERLEVKNKRVLIVLDPGVVFTKTISLSNSERKTIKQLIGTYNDLIPYPVGQRISLRVEESDMLSIFATNSRLYLCLIEGIKAAGSRKILAVTPAELYDLNYGLKANEFIAQFLEDKQARKRADFLESSPF